MKHIWLGTLLTAMVSEAANAQTNLVTNPQFDLPGFSTAPNYRYLNGANTTFLTGWTFIYDNVNEASYVFKDTRYPVFSGDYAVQLGDGDSCETQVTTEVDCTYVLIVTMVGGDGGSVRFRAGNLDTSFVPTISSLVSVGTGKKRDSNETPPVEQEWFKVFLPFTATSTSTTVRLDDAEQSFSFNGQLLGHVAVVAGPAIMVAPKTAAKCNGGEIEFHVKAAGVGPITYEWQIETSTGVWAALSGTPVSLSCGGSATATGYDQDTAQITVHGCYEVGTYNVRCVVANSCGSVNANAMYELCWSDFNCDGIVDDSDFVAFTAAYTLLDCNDSLMPAGCPSDLNGDGLVDDEDFVIFGAAYALLNCHRDS